MHWQGRKESNPQSQFWRLLPSPSGRPCIGRPGGSRTHSVRRRRVLSALRKPFRHWPGTWWPARDSNPEQLVSETSASAKIAPAGHLVLGARFELAAMRLSTAHVSQLRHPSITGVVARPSRVAKLRPGGSRYCKLSKILAESRRLERLCPRGRLFSKQTGLPTAHALRSIAGSWPAFHIQSTVGINTKVTIGITWTGGYN